MAGFGLEIRSSIDSSILMSTEMSAMLFVGKGVLVSTSSPLLMWNSTQSSGTPYYNGWTEHNHAYFSNGQYVQEYDYTAWGFGPCVYGGVTMSQHWRTVFSANSNYPISPQYEYIIRAPSSIPLNVSPICFVKPPENVNFYSGLPYINNNRWEVKVTIYSPIMPETYWFYNPINKTPSDNTYGLRVFNQDGIIHFDSGWGNFGSIREIPNIGYVNNATASYSPITKPAFLYINGFISNEIVTGSNHEWYYSAPQDVYCQYGYSYDITYAWSKRLVYHRYLKYNSSSSDVIRLTDLSPGFENRSSIPQNYQSGTSGEYGSNPVGGGYSPDGIVLYVPIIDAALFD